MIVLPEQDAVVALFTCTENMQVILDALWEHLLPAMSDEHRPPTDADAALVDRLARATLPTVAERQHGEPPDLAPMTFTPGTVGGRSHKSVTAIDVADGRLTIHEGDESIDLPLSIGWSVVGARATNAARLTDGRVGVDVSFLETPHRLEIALDPETATFATRWPHVLLRPGRLSSLVAPD
jgi:hypothetical protein